MARDNIYENMPMTEAAPRPKGNPPETLVSWQHRARGTVIPVLLLLGLALATSLLAVTLLYLRAQSKLQAVEEAVQKLQVSLQPDDASDASAKGSDSDVLRKLSRGWRFYGGNLYYFSQGRKSWDEAEQFCVSRDSHLTSVSSQAEQEFLSNETKGEAHWIGLTDRETEGSWRWVDGTEYRASRGFWAENEPNNHDPQKDGGEDCVHTEPRVRNLWNDYKCIQPFRWICKQAHT